MVCSSPHVLVYDPSKVLQENYGTLVDSIQDADTLADHLYEEGVIAGNVREKVEGCRTAKEKNRVLITAVQQQVGVNQKSFQYFIDALKMDESNEAVLSRLAMVFGGYENSILVASLKSSGQAPPSSKELKGVLSIQDDDGKMEEVEEEEEGTRVVAARQFTATMSTPASKPLLQQSGDHSKVRQRHIERMISPASPTKLKKKPVVCDGSFWILMVLAFVTVFFAWDHYLTGDTSYITQLVHKDLPEATWGQSLVFGLEAGYSLLTREIVQSQTTGTGLDG
eukprot:Em0003g205a